MFRRRLSNRDKRLTLAESSKSAASKVPSFRKVTPSASTRGALCFRGTKFVMKTWIMRSSPNWVLAPLAWKLERSLMFSVANLAMQNNRPMHDKHTRQALFEGIATWVRLPRNRWPKSWTNYRDPVCPLRLALYGHPDSGGIWEKHCTKQLRSIGWVPVLPDIWQSIFYHPELDLLLVVYVDDFKMAGPKDNLAKGWEGISKVLAMDPAEPLGRYFGCNHREQTSVKALIVAHIRLPMSLISRRVQLAAKAGGNSEPRTEDYWEVDPEHALVVRHHLYPRKPLCSNRG